jgi:hypothetical protein
VPFFIKESLKGEVVTLLLLLRFLISFGLLFFRFT